jgi:hypothetical protein
LNETGALGAALRHSTFWRVNDARLSKSLKKRVHAVLMSRFSKGAKSKGNPNPSCTEPLGPVTA